MKIAFGKKKFSFKESFSEFTLREIMSYMSIHSAVDDLIKKSEQKLRDLENIGDEISKITKAVTDERIRLSNEIKDITELSDLEKKKRSSQTKIENLESKYIDFENEMIFIDSDLTDLQFEITGKRIDFLCLLCKNNSFRDFVMNTQGMNRELINIAVSACIEKFGSFVDFWDSCHNVTSFKFKEKSSFFRTEFLVHEFDKTTLVRETLASVQAQRALNYKAQLDSGSFQNICNFIAILVRPKNEKEEISHTKKSFLSGKRLKGLSQSDKLAFYLDELEKTWTKRAESFIDLRLDVAIGVLKEYFKKKRV